MPQLNHRKLELLFSPSSGSAPSLQGDEEDAVKRRWRINMALGVQMVYAAFTIVFAVYETRKGSLVHKRPPAELVKVLAYSMSCLSVYRSVPAYLRLMLIWTITTAFSGVYQSLFWLDNVTGSATERRLVWILLALSIAGMVANIIGATTVFPSGGVSRRLGRGSYKPPQKES